MRSSALLSLVLLGFAWPVLCKVSRSKHLPPVILIPGDGGSQIEAKINKTQTIHYICYKFTDYWFDLWLNMELLAPYFIDCWVDNMKLVYDNATRTTRNVNGVQTRVPGFGNSSTVEWLDPSHRSPTGYFKDVVNALIPLGYERGVTVRGAPFDFRRAPNEQSEYFLKLRRLIEETYQYSGRKVMLILHSMGASMMRYFLTHQPQHWKDKHIETVVALAGAWGGSMKAVKVYTAGDNLGIYMISPLKIRTEQRSAPSLAFLLPSPEVWGPDEVFLETDTMNITTSNIKDMFDALNLPDAYDMYLDTKDLILNTPAPGVELHCLYGTGVPTVEKMIYNKKNSFPDNPQVINGDGDGTVNNRSAELCLKWRGQQKQEIYHKELKGVDHTQILHDKGSIGYIVELAANISKKNQALAEAKMKNLHKMEKEIVSNSVVRTEDKKPVRVDNFKHKGVPVEKTLNSVFTAEDSFQIQDEDRRKNTLKVLEENDRS